MKIYHFGGTVECKSIEELISVLNIRYGEGVNEFIISGEKKYPSLAIMVNNEHAVVTYMPERDGYLFQATCGFTKLNSDKINVFYTGTEYQEIEVWNELVIPFSKAKQVAIEYFNTLSLPTCIEWSKQ